MNDPRYMCELDSVDKYGDTPLFNACRLGNIEIVRELITKPGCTRIFVNHITKETPAHIACRNNRLDILQMLLTEGDCNTINCLGESLLHIACDNNTQPVIDFLIENKICTSLNMDHIIRSPLHIACIRGNAETAKKLITTSGVCKSTDTDMNGNTILHYICNRQLVNPEMLEIFKHDMEANKMIEMKNSQGQNPLHLIFENDGIQTFHCLSKHLSVEGVNVALHSVDERSDSPLHVAFRQEGTLTVKYFLNCPQLTEGVSRAICTLNSNKDSPLHILCKMKKFESLMLVVKSPSVEHCIGEALTLQDAISDNLFHIAHTNGWSTVNFCSYGPLVIPQLCSMSRHILCPKLLK